MLVRDIKNTSQVMMSQIIYFQNSENKNITFLGPISNVRDVLIFDVTEYVTKRIVYKTT